jgi:hypothetical protein
MKAQLLRWVLALALLAGCASQNPIRCDDHLVPINAPHPKTSSAPESAK